MKKLIVLLFVFLSTSLAYSQYENMSDEELSRLMMDSAYINKLYCILLDKSPNPKIYNQRIKIAEEDIGIQKLSWLNFLGISFTYYPGFINQTQENVNTNDYKIGLGVTFNIGTMFKVSKLVSQANERLKLEEYSYESQKLSARAEMIKRFAGLITATKILKLKIKAAEESLENTEMTKYKFEKGEETLENYNKALYSLTSNLIEKAKSEAEYVVAKALLEEILGIKLEEIK